MAEQPVIGFAPIDEALGPFDEHSFLGIGSFGETHRVRKDGEDFAVKVIYAAGLPDYFFAREIEALRRVAHPNVMGFIESGTLESAGETYPYLLCEYVRGETVSDKLNNAEVPASADAVRLMLSGLLRGVAAIHGAQILHRDISARTGMLREGRWGQPVLLDFGLARVLHWSGHTVYPQPVGTPLYMSPEQLSGKPAVTRSDLYAVGAVVYHGCTHQHPFDAESYPTMELLLRRMEEKPPRDPRDISELFDDATAQVVMRLLSFEGYERLTIGRALEDLDDA